MGKKPPDLCLKLLYFFDPIRRISNLWLKLMYFFMKKLKLKSKKYEDFSCKQGKLAFSLNINITKMGKMHKSE